MNKKKYDIVVYIGRFQPLHNGHVNIIQQISQIANEVIVIVGSKSNPVTVKNPFTYDERKEMIEKSTHVQYMKIYGVEDYTYDDYRWIAEITDIVNNESCSKYDPNKNTKIAIAGFNKDDSSSYLKYFPQWDLIEQLPYKEYGNMINATDIRTEFYKNNLHYLNGIIPAISFRYLQEMGDGKKYYLINEYNEIIRTQETYGLGNFITTDAIVVQSGHILLIKRKESGVDLWAMVGGFLELNETLDHCVIRELREETRLKVPEKVLMGSIKEKRLFDKPDRDLRGRIITQVYLFELDDALPLPKVKGHDDAKEAKWIPIGDFYNMRSEMYSDHFHIIEKMLDGV